MTNTNNNSATILHAPTGSTASDLDKFPVAHDFILDGKPQAFMRKSNGNYNVSVGSIVLTTFGIGEVRHQNLIELQEDSPECARRAEAHNNSALLKAGYWESKMEGDLDVKFNKIAKTIIAEALESLLDSNQLQQGTDHTKLLSGSVLFSEVMVTPREARKQARKALERQASKLIAGYEDEDEDEDVFIPSDIADEFDAIQD